MSDRLKLDEKGTRSLGLSGIGGMLAAFITSPFGGALLGLESAHAGVDYVWTLFPTLVASSFATVTFVLLSRSFFRVVYEFADYKPQLLHLLLALPLGLMGALAGCDFHCRIRLSKQADSTAEQVLGPPWRDRRTGIRYFWVAAAFDVVFGCGRNR